jgi:hypothetical protein
VTAGPAPPAIGAAPNPASPDRSKLYEMVAGGCSALLGAAALILTVSLGIVTVGQTTSAGLLEELRLPVILSGLSLIVSLASGGVVLAALYGLTDPVTKRDFLPSLHRWAVGCYRIQFWGFVFGASILFWAVLIRVGVVNGV